MEKGYTNRELDTLFDTINGKLDLIHDQTLKTNGRVTSLESYKYSMIGGLAVVSVMIVPLLINLLTK